MSERRNKNMLVVSYEYPPLGGGGAKVVDGLISRLVNQGYNIDLVTMGFRGLPRHEERDGLRIFRVPGIRRNLSMCRAYEMVPYILAGSFVAWRLARANPYEINHTHFIFPDSLISAVVKKLTGLPFVTTSHGSDVPGYNPNRFQLMHKALRPVWRWLTGQIDRIVCPSSFIQRLILKSNPHARTVIIPNGIELDRFSPDVEKQQRILCVTRMFERKGVQYLIEAFRKLRRADWQLTLVGDGPYLETIENLAAGSANIDIVGFLDNKGPELRKLYEESAIFALNSSSENFPIVLLEAMTAGAAVVTTKGTGCADVVGDTAELVTPESTDELLGALKRLVDDPGHRRQLARRGRARVEELFSWQSVVRQHVALFDEAARSESDSS
jgi:glycosyltransferase involved in cell wall biosynthesis